MSDTQKANELLHTEVAIVSNQLTQLKSKVNFVFILTLIILGINIFFLYKYIETIENFKDGVNKFDTPAEEVTVDTTPVVAPYETPIVVPTETPVPAVSNEDKNVDANGDIVEPKGE